MGGREKKCAADDMNFPNWRKWERAMLRRTFILRSIISVFLLDAVFLAPWSRNGHALENRAIAPIAVTPDPIVGEMLRQVDRDRTLSDLRQLTGEIPICVGTACNTISDRFTGSIGLEWAMDYLYEDLVSLGYSPERRSWSSSGYTGQNLLARKAGVVAPNEEIYIVAHVDGIRSTGALGPAADDNASGTVDLLELARVLKGHPFERTIVLLFSTGEEQGTLGVSAYFNHLSPLELNRIKFAIDVDMVGFDGNGDRVMELWHGGETSSMALTQMMSDTIRAYQLDLDPRLITGCG
jgi:hypothetical protein